MSEQNMVDVQVDEMVNSHDEGQTALLTIRPVKGEKIQLEFAQVIPTPASGNTVLGMFNESDDRFTGRSARRAWLSAQPEDAKKYLPEISDEVDKAIDEDRKVFVGNINPETSNGKQLLLQVTEDHSPSSDWEVENLKQSAKQDGNENYLLKGGKLIFSHVDVVADEANHTFIQHDSTTTDPYGADMDIDEDADQSPIAEEEQEETEETVTA